MKLRDLPGLLKETALAWYEDNTLRLGAALAYYTVFSLSPLLVIAVAIAGAVFGRQAAEGRIAAEYPREGLTAEKLVRAAAGIREQA